MAIAENGSHAASDYLEDAVIAGVRTVGCRRSAAGSRARPSSRTCRPGRRSRRRSSPARSCSRARARASRRWRRTAPSASSARAARAVRRVPACTRRPRAGRRGRRRPPARRRPVRAQPRAARGDPGRRARGGLHHGPTGGRHREPVLVSTNLARRSALGEELDRAAAERADVYLTELKAAAIDTVAMRARAEGARRVHPQPADRHRRRTRQALPRCRQEMIGPARARPRPPRDHRRPQGPRAALLEGPDGADDLRDRAVARPGLRARS